MFKRRRKDGGTMATSEEAPSPAPSSTPVSPPPPQHRRAGSATFAPGQATPLEAPRNNFAYDFLAFPALSPFASSTRPQTSDGIAPKNSNVAYNAPMLPPIPRVSSTREGPSLLELMGGPQESEEPAYVSQRFVQEPEPGPVRLEYTLDSPSEHAPASTVTAPLLSIPTTPTASMPTPPVASASTTPTSTSVPRLPSFSRPSLSPCPSQKDYRQSPSSSTEAPRMESSLFPSKIPSPQQPSESDLPMSREFIDSRDKPYAPPMRARPQLQTTNSSPDLRSPLQPINFPPSPSSAASVSGPLMVRPSTQQSQSTGNINHLVRPPSNSATNYSGTTARSRHSSKSTAIGSDAPTLTVGTPYQETSQSFPLPQHVATRPKTIGTMASIGGVDVPTHHTSSLNKRPEAVPKTEKRKTKLLNPMLLLSRRRTGVEDEAVAGVRAAQAQAVQRQRNVAAELNKMPDDFDPRIKGKVVHDFSAPRDSRRMFSYNDSLDASDQMQSSSSTPYMSASNDEWTRQGSNVEGGQRRSMHTPVFTEHLSEDAPGSSDAAAIQAEKLENKAFLNRASLMSQDTSSLPPFARRSQLVEPLQTSVIQQDSLSSDRGPAVNKEQQRDSHMSSSSSGISPITQRNSTLPGAADVSNDGVSPISPTSSERHGGLLFSRQISRPVSEVSRLDASDGAKAQRMSEVSRMSSSDEPRTASTFSSASIKPASSPSDAAPAMARSSSGIEPIKEELTPKLEAGPWTVPERAAPVQISTRDYTRFSHLMSGPARDSPTPASTTSSRGVASPLPTPETHIEDPITAPSSSPSVVRNSTDAGEQRRRSSSSAKPRKHVSNASRFSFQFGGSAAEEHALEEKARQIGVESTTDDVKDFDDDDDDYFDEDAMNDMDEMEVEAGAQHDDLVGSLPVTTSIIPPSDDEPVSPLTPTFAPIPDVHGQFQFDDDDSDGVSEPGSDEEVPYWLHDALRSYTHTREPSAVDGNIVLEPTRTFGVQGPTVDTNLRPNSNSNGLYMHPGARAYVPATDRNSIAQKPPLPHRDSGNSEKNRVASGLSFGEDPATHKTTLSKSTVGSEGETTDRSFNDSSAGRSGSSEVAGLGLSGFSGFKFTDTPDVSRPTSYDAMQKFSADRRRGDSETLPQDAAFANTGLAKSSLDLSSPLRDYNHHYHQYDLDDMYYDDGGFDSAPGQMGDTVDEDEFDDDRFLDTTNRMARYEQPRSQNSERALSYLAIAGDGPYPTFARPNSSKIRERDSRLMLEDLPLLHEPVDPKLIPRRNPSEDAKRLGLSDRVPPLPAQEGMSGDAAAKLQDKVHAYHAMLAEAAQKAFEEGRFGDQDLLNVPERADSVSDRAGSQKTRSRMLEDRTSHYSRYEDNEQEEDNVPSLNGRSFGRTDSTQLPQGISYSPVKMNFDFGFDSIGLDDSVVDDIFGSDADDDIVAAANAEALANDDDGFYGQEFGFYAKARPNSGEVEAINGGFFGLDGDDGLSRQRSMKEPNLTPITELSEWSRRTSFIGAGMGGQMATPGLGSFSPLTPAGIRLPVSPWLDNEVQTLRKLKVNAFGGSNGSLHSHSGSDGSAGQPNTTTSATALALGRNSPAAQGYFGMPGSHPMTFAYSNDSSASSNPSSAHPANNHAQYSQQQQMMIDSPQSPSFGAQQSFPDPSDATPKRPVVGLDTPPLNTTVRKFSDRVNKGHSRNSSGADSVTYVREQDPDGQRPPRWVLEKRRTSEAGQLELVAREVVQDGWI